MLQRTKLEKQLEVIKLYNEGLSQVKIGKVLHMTGKTIKEILKNSPDTKYRNLSEATRNRHGYTLNESSFDNLENEEVAYWIGFLYADGHVEKSSNGISLGLSIKDKSHIEKFKIFLQSSSPIRESVGITRGKEHIDARFVIYSNKMKTRLQGLGFDNNKTKTAKPSEELKYNRHFWRGVIDGDGCIHIDRSNKINIHLCGTKDTIQGFIDFANYSGLETKALPRETKDRELYQTIFEAKKGHIIYNILYKDSKIKLDRKYHPQFIGEYNYKN